MEFAPVDIDIIRRFSVMPFVMKKTAKEFNLSQSDLTLLFLIYSLTSEPAKGVRMAAIIKTKIRAQTALYTSVWVLEAASLIERRKRVKTAPFTLYITDSGRAVILFFLAALKRAEREKLGARPDKQAQAKGGRISRKPKK